jgi:FAD synthase
LRDERKFHQVSELIKQVQADIIEAESILDG